MDPKADYVIDAALGDDVAQHILDFYADQPKKGLREIGIVEVQAIVRESLFFLARDGQTGEIVATLYFTCHGFQDGQLVYEIGGGTVTAAHLNSGVMACLANCALVSFAMAGTLSDTDARPLVRLIGLVEESNPDPIRLLIGVGFREPDPAYRETLPAGKRGVDHMRDKDGNVVVRRFEYDFKQLHERVKQAIDWRTAGVLKPASKLQTGEPQKTVRIDLPHFTPNPEGDPLTALLKAAQRMADGP